MNHEEIVVRREMLQLIRDEVQPTAIQAERAVGSLFPAIGAILTDIDTLARILHDVLEHLTPDDDRADTSVPPLTASVVALEAELMAGTLPSPLIAQEPCEKSGELLVLGNVTNTWYLWITGDDECGIPAEYRWMADAARNPAIAEAVSAAYGTRDTDPTPPHGIERPPLVPWSHEAELAARAADALDARAAERAEDRDEFENMRGQR
jgi:hypothetical protein